MAQAAFVTAFNVDETVMQRPTVKRNTAAQLLLGNYRDSTLTFVSGSAASNKMKSLR